MEYVKLTKTVMQSRHNILISLPQALLNNQITILELLLLLYLSLIIALRLNIPYTLIAY